MKKIYLKPQMKVVRLKKQQLLSTSTVGMYGRNATSEAMSRGLDDDDIDFNE